MKKHLYIILLILPLIGFGQGFNIKIGTTCIVPFTTNNIGSSELLTTSKLGVQSSISYDFTFQDISDNFLLSPSFTYTLLKSNYYEQTGPMSMDLYNYNHLIHFSLNSGYKFYNRIIIKFGLSLDSKLSNNIKGIYRYENSTSWNEYFGLSDDPILPNQVEEDELKFANNEFKLLGLSGNLSFEFQVNQVVSIYSTFLFTFNSSDIEDIVDFSDLGGNGNMRTLLPRKYISFGIGLNI